MKRNHLVTVGVAAVALVTGMLLAGAPVRSVLLPLLLLACPLMMLFMMRGHGHGGGEERAGHEARKVGDDPKQEAGKSTTP